ncbi:MAG: phosphoserine phosphatase SerB [Polyangiales bacterium]
MNATRDIRALWAAAQAVCFDVDSTVSPDEGIDLLAAQAGVGDRVAALTRDAMGGAVRFEDALRARLDLIRPSRGLLDACLAAHPPRLTPGVDALVARLIAQGTHVYLVSGGFTEMIRPLAARLGIDPARVFANTLRFGPDGGYAGFDEAAFTSRTGGKSAALQHLKDRFGYAPLIMVGDGVTDLEARPPADGFIGYGGVVARDRVRADADWFVTDFAELLVARPAG